MDDWYLDDTKSVRQAITDCESYWTHRKKYHKIILTTDTDLIKDGVQVIDDDFDADPYLVLDGNVNPGPRKDLIILLHLLITMDKLGQILRSRLQN